MRIQIKIKTKKGNDVLNLKYAKFKLMLMRFGGNVSRIEETPIILILEHKTLSRVNMENPFIEPVKAGIEKSLESTFNKIGLEKEDYETEFIQ